VATIDLDLWDRMMAVNLRGTMLACRHRDPGAHLEWWWGDHQHDLDLRDRG